MRLNCSPAWALTLILALLAAALLTTAQRQPALDLPENPTSRDFAPPGAEPLQPIKPSPLTTISLAPGAEPTPLLTPMCTSLVGRDCAIIIYCRGEGRKEPACLRCALAYLDEYQITDQTLYLCEACVGLPDEDKSEWLSGYRESASTVKVQCSPDIYDG